MLLLVKVGLLFALGDAVDLVLVDGMQGAVLGYWQFAVDGLANNPVAGGAEEEFLRAPLHSGELGEAGV